MYICTHTHTTHTLSLYIYICSLLTLREAKMVRNKNSGYHTSEESNETYGGKIKKHGVELVELHVF